MLMDCTAMTNVEMADLIRAVRNEVKQRNPLLANFYIGAINDAVDALEAIAEGIS